MMKEMKYQEEPKREILSTGYSKGLLYFIMNLGIHPTAYVKIPKNYEIDINNIEVHGGITYEENHLWVDNDKVEGHFIGWDYCHYGDYGGYEEILPKQNRIGGKKWTTKEIFEEVVNVCYQIQKMKGEQDVNK